jgi:hypothetical protein
MGDPRVKDWFLMSSPIPVIILCLSYVGFVKFIGPKLMERRKAFELRKIMICYNLFQVLFNLWLFLEAISHGWLGRYSFRCVAKSSSTSPEHMSGISACYWYFILKLTEFGDGIFFVLRKKKNQISNLHLIHHSVMPFSGKFTEPNTTNLN